MPGDDFYSYADKYEDGTAQLHAPAPLTDAETTEVQTLAVAAFQACRCEAMARVDFFLEEQRADGRPGRGFLVNEVNTIPGFTPISMFPRLWDLSGVPYPELLDRLIELASLVTNAALAEPAANGDAAHPGFRRAASRSRWCCRKVVTTAAQLEVLQAGWAVFGSSATL